jgi:hypothetical protein
LTPGSGIRDRQKIRIRVDHISESLETIYFRVKILKFFDGDPGFGMEKIWIRDGKNSDKHPGSATLLIMTKM